MTRRIPWASASLIVLGMVFAHPGLAEECTFHVSAQAVTGTGNGSEGSPWTLQEANDETVFSGAIDPGDVVCLHADGVYQGAINPRGGGSAIAGPITFRNVPGITTVLPVPWLSVPALIGLGLVVWAWGTRAIPRRPAA